MSVASAVKRATARRSFSFGIPGMGKYCALLALACLLAFVASILPVVMYGKSLVWANDGMAIYLNAMMYAGESIRGAFCSLVSGEGFNLPTFLFNLGYGIDASSVIAYWNPATWLSALIPTAYTEYYYYFVIYVRLVLSALSFSLYCLSRGNGKAPSFVSSLIYAFGGFALFWGALRHPGFLVVLYTLPLILFGADRILVGKSPVVFVLALAYMFIQSAYFSVMVCLFTAIYCCVMYFYSDRQKSIKDLVLVVAKFLAFGLVSILMSAASCLPSVLALVQLDRISTGTEIPLLFNFTYYGEYVLSLLGGAVKWENSKLFVGPVGVVSLIVFVVARKRVSATERKPWLILFGFVLACTLFPYLEHVMHGFSYVSDRWFFIASFVISYVVCLAIPLLDKLESGDWKKVFGVSAVVCLLALAPIIWRANTRSIFGSVFLFCLVVASIVVFYKKAGPKLRVVLLSGFTIIGVAASCFFLCALSPWGGNYQSQFYGPIGSGEAYYSGDSPYEVVNELPESERQSSRYSFATIYDAWYFNESLTQDRMGISCFANPYNQYIDDFRDELGLSDAPFSNTYSGNDGRLALEAFSGAKYYVATGESGVYAPASYDDMGMSKNNSQLFSTEYAFSLVSVYGQRISNDDYQNMNMVEKQEAILQGIVLNDDASVDGCVSADEIKISSERVAYSIAAEDGIEITENGVIVKNKKSRIRIEFAGEANCETYLCFDRLAYQDPESNAAELSNMTIKEWIATLDKKPASSYTITASSQIGEKKISPTTSYSAQYCAKNDWVMNMGYSEDPINSIEVSFSREGTYSFDSMDVVIQPVTTIEEELQQKKSSEGCSASIDSSRNTINASVRAEEGEYALFSVAYTPGWKAVVDGRPANVYRADTGFVAVKIDSAGAHEITLSYETPGYFQGQVLTVIGFALFAGVIFFGKRKESRKQ